MDFVTLVELGLFVGVDWELTLHWWFVWIVWMLFAGFCCLVWCVLSCCFGIFWFELFVLCNSNDCALS